MNHDLAWQTGAAIQYPPLPPPTRDETAFLEEIAALGDEWPQIMHERTLRAEVIENRISNARLEASLPQFESFAFGNPHPLPTTAARSFLATSRPTQFYDQPQQLYTEPVQPPAALPSVFEHDVPNQLSSHLPHSSNWQPPLASLVQHGGALVDNGRTQDRFTSESSGTWRPNHGLGGSYQVQPIESQLKPAHWWEQQNFPAQAPSQFDAASKLNYQNLEHETRSVQHRSIGTANRPEPLYQHQPQTSQFQPQAHFEHHGTVTPHRPLPPPLPTTLSQLPYHQPSREWNQALPLPYPTRDPPYLERGFVSLQHYHEASASSSSEVNDPLPTGLTYATSASSPSTDRSRQSSTNFYGGFSAATDQYTLSSFATSSGAGKRTRFDSSNYSRPPLATQPHVVDTPSSSSQHTSSSSSSLPTTASLDSHSLPPSVSPGVPISKNLSAAAKAPPDSNANPNPNLNLNSAIAPGNRRGNKSKVDVNVSCVACGNPIARLILRGQKHELEVPYEAVFRCLECTAPGGAIAVAVTGGGGGGMGGGVGGNEDNNSPSTFGERSPSDSPHHVLPPSRRTSVVSNPNSATATAGTSTSTSSSSTVTTPTIPTTFRKKTKRLDVGQATLTACDVCLMDRATGSVLPREPERGHAINFQIEVVCASCDQKYQRCSDCGGGGGVRLGTGKYRSKELFKDGKKTCSLRHQRLGAFPEMEYQVWRNTDLPKDELEEVSEKCGELFANQMLGAIAIPEVLERNGAIWTSFAEAQSHAYSGWRGMDPMIRYNVEPSLGIRRYLALRLCSPNLRKTARKAEVPPAVETPRTGQILKGDKEIVGYIIAEWDMKRGVLFLALVIPWDATGEAYDATTLLLQALCTRVQRDQREENELRSARGEPLLPKLERVFTMLFFKTGSRMITQLTKKRGFAPIDEYLAANPRADPRAFPPHRPIYLPNERQQGWLVLIRTLRENADGSVDDWSARRSADEERGKRKEARAKLAREKKAKEEESGFE